MDAKSLTIAFLFIVQGFCPVALATQDQIYGLGGPSTARVGGLSAEVEQPFAALSNPGLLGATESPALCFSISTVQFSPQLSGEVLLDSPDFFTRSGNLRTGTPEIASSNSTLWSLGFRLPIKLPPWIGTRAGLGIVTSGPLGQLRRYSSVTPYDFSLLKYGAAETQFKLTTSLGVELVRRHVYLGAGVSFYLHGAGDAQAQILSNNPIGRLALDVGLSSAPLVGVFTRIDSTENPHQVGLVYRRSVQPTFQQSLEGTVQILKENGKVTVPALLSSNLYYEPETLELDWQKRWGQILISAGVSYQLWSKYQPSYVRVEAQEAGGEKRSTYFPDLSLRNTWNPRVSFDGPFFQTGFSWTVGYQLRPSAIPRVWGDSNLLDPTTHVLATAIRTHLGASEAFPIALEIGIFGQWHFFEPLDIRKENANSIGSPGYTLRGTASHYGLSLLGKF